MSLMTDTKTFLRFWAAIESDYEAVLSSFLSSEEWTFEAFAQICKDNYITLMLHCTQSSGQMKKEQYRRVMRVILQTLKGIWVYETDFMKDGPQEYSQVLLKKKLGALYLLYAMYVKQPISGMVKILVDEHDLDSIQRFGDEIKKIKTKDNIPRIVSSILFKLKLDDAFTLTCVSEEFGIDIFMRAYLNAKKSRTTKMICEEKTLIDATFANPIITEYSDSFYQVNSESLRNFGFTPDYMGLVKKTRAQKIVNDGSISNLTTTTAIIDPIANTTINILNDRMDSIVEISRKVFNKPILTAQNLIAHESIDRIKINEARKRIEHAKKKEEMEKSAKGKGQIANPYVRPGGIFGRKKEELGKDKKARKSRSQASENLWSYIRN